MNKIFSAVVLFLFCNLMTSQVLRNSNNLVISGDFESCSSTIPANSGECVEVGPTSSCANWLANAVDNGSICANSYPQGGNYYGSMKKVIQDGVTVELRGFEATMTELLAGNRYRLSFDVANFGSDSNNGEDLVSGVAVSIGYENFFERVQPFNSNVEWETVSIEFCTYEVTQELILNPTILNPESNTSSNLGIDNIILERLTEPAFCKTQCANCSSFELVKNEKYVISGWVKEADKAFETTYDECYIEIAFTQADGQAFPDVPLIQLFPTGEIIDGWQKITGEFTVPDSTEEINLEITLRNNSSDNAFFDDIRVHPFNGNLKSFVYDQETQKLMAELDENNYATFYEYDKEGGLVRVKKETEKGVYTIQETRSSNIKKEE